MLGGRLLFTRMKRLGSFAMAAGLLCSLCACQASGKSTASVVNTSSVAQESTKSQQQTETGQTTHMVFSLLSGLMINLIL